MKTSDNTRNYCASCILFSQFCCWTLHSAVFFTIKPKAASGFFAISCADLQYFGALFCSLFLTIANILSSWFRDKWLLRTSCFHLPRSPSVTEAFFIDSFGLAPGVAQSWPPADGIWHTRRCVTRTDTNAQGDDLYGEQFGGVSLNRGLLCCPEVVCGSACKASRAPLAQSWGLENQRGSLVSALALWERSSVPSWQATPPKWALNHGLMSWFISDWC